MQVMVKIIIVIQIRIENRIKNKSEDKVILRCFITNVVIRPTNIVLQVNAGFGLDCLLLMQGLLLSF